MSVLYIKINVTSTLLKVSNPTKPQTPTYFFVFALRKYFVKLPFLLSLFCRNCQDQLRCAHCIFFLSLFSTEGFSPSQNIIVKPWVYMSFFIIQVYFRHALLLVQNRSLLCVFSCKVYRDIFRFSEGWTVLTETIVIGPFNSLFPKGPSLYYVSIFLGFFRPTHPLY